jgi:hypothetical protein
MIPFLKSWNLTDDDVLAAPGVLGVGRKAASPLRLRPKGEA